METYGNIINKPVPLSFGRFCRKIKEKDCEVPDHIIQKASDVFNKLHGLKKIEKIHRVDIERSTIETNHQDSQANKHVFKIYKKVDEAAFENLQLILEIIDYYKNKK